MSTHPSDDFSGQSAPIPDRNTDLALMRTQLALDRTQLAWVRTGFVFITAGIAMDKVMEVLHHQRMIQGTNWVKGAHVTGLVMILSSTLALVLTLAGYVRAARKLALLRGEPAELGGPVAMTVLLILVGIVLALLVMTTNLASPD